MIVYGRFCVKRKGASLVKWSLKVALKLISILHVHQIPRKFCSTRLSPNSIGFTKSVRNSINWIKLQRAKSLSVLSDETDDFEGKPN